MNKQLAEKITVQSLIALYKKKGYALFTDQSKDWNANLFAVRSVDPDMDKFNCIIGYYKKFANQDFLYLIGASTHPGKAYFLNPYNGVATHILAEGQYKGMFSIGLHAGLYAALIQTGITPKFYVDRDRDPNFDEDPKTITQYTYPIWCNLHTVISKKVDLFTSNLPANIDSNIVSTWSAACQVAQNPLEYLKLMCYLVLSRANWGNSFSYSLFHENDFN